MAKGDKKPVERILKSTIVILASIGGGVLTGLLARDFARTIAPIGGIYLDLLKMTVFPILMTAIITSVGRLFGHPQARTYLRRTIAVFLIALFACSVIALAFGLFIQPGKGLSKNAQVTLGRTLSEADKSGSRIESTGQTLLSFLKQLIPENIFKSMGEGDSLQILFFSLVLGIAVGILRPENRDALLNVTDSLFRAFFRIIQWIMYLLPIGLFTLLAGQIADTGLETMAAMAKFVIAVYATCLTVFTLCAAIISVRARVSVSTAVDALRGTLLVAFGTQSTFASMPAAIEGLTGERLNVDRGLVNLVIPIGVVINRFSMIIIYTLATVFAAQLYAIQLGWGGLALTIPLTILAAVAGAGTPGIVSIAMVSMIFTPLGLPSSTIIVLLLAINPVIDPFTTATNMYANCAATTLVATGRVPVMEARSATVR